MRTSSRAPAAIVLAAATALSVAACTAGSDASGAPVATDHVDLPRSYKFDPPNITVVAGTTVTWTNNDDFSHSVRFLDGEPSGEPLVMQPGESVEQTFDEPGTYRYDCSFHPNNMRGSVTVTAPDGSGP